MTRPALLIAALAAATLAAVGCGRGYDPYDDDLRGTNPSGTSRLVFGQAIGPDGDGCWPENDRDYSGRVFCDLVSLGGLHWDAGDVKVAKSADILMGSGYVCLLDEDGVPWCWEWSQEVQPPRLARVPDDQMFLFLSVPTGFRRVEGEKGFVCGQVLGALEIVCWTVGVDQSPYREARHRFTDSEEWVLRSVSDDPPSFRVGRRGTGRQRSFHAFTGAALGSDPSVPGVLVTEAVP